VPVRRIKVTKGDRLCILCRLCVRNWLDESVELIINKRNVAHKVWHDNINRIRGDKYGGFVSVNLDSSLPSLYQNLRRLRVVNAPKTLQV
jgi:hypothetical protein